MRVVASDEVGAYVEANGGVLDVNAHGRQCCSGSMTVLDTSTREPADPTSYRAFDSGELRVRFCGGGPTEPDEPVVEMKGLRRKRPVAYWDGCAFKI